MWILQSRKPAFEIGRLRLRIAAQRFDESKFRKLCEQRLGAGPLGQRFLHANVKQIAEPAAFRDVAEWYA